MNITKSILVLFLIVTSSKCAFQISSTSTCTDTSNAAYCQKWSQTGTVEQQTVSCFPQNMRVMTRNGFKMMGSLQTGDEILGMHEGQEVFTKVKGWFHHDQNAQGMYLNFIIGQNFLTVSAKHNVALENGQFVFAEECLKKKLQGNGKDIEKIQNVIAKGKYSPSTQSRNYFVYFENENNSRVLAHNFAHIRNPISYEFIVGLIESTWNIFDSSAKNAKVHPSYIWMQKTFSFLQE